MSCYSKWVLILLLLSVSTGCAHYTRGPWMGKVIDSETKQPIEGVVVVAVWWVDFAAVIERHAAYVDAVETLTNQNGYFEISAKSYSSMRSDAHIFGPSFTIYKPGYGCFPRSHTYPKEWEEYRALVEYEDHPKGWKDYFEEQGATVELPKIATRDGRIKSMHDAESLRSDDIPKSKIPNLLKLINSERVYFGFQPY